MINRELINKKKERLYQLTVAVFYGDVEEIQRLFQESIEEDLGLLETEIPNFFPGKPIKDMLTFALKAVQSESAKALLDLGAKISKEARMIIADQFPALTRYLVRKS